MSQNEKFVIVGAGLAGASAAETLRAEGFDGSIELIGAEPYPPYIRPPLSKEYLSGKDPLESAFVHPQEWYAENNVNLVTGKKVVGIDPAAHTISASDGSTTSYTKLLLTTGSSPRELSIPGSDLSGVYYLRTMDDAKALRSLLEAGGKRLVLVGSGWIGMEVAATAKTLGNEVTILERDPIPLAIALGDELGQKFADMHKAEGVVLRLSVVVDKIVGSENRVTGVQINGGETVPADLVLIGVGAIPNVQLAEAAGLDVERGILTDEFLQTSDPDIYAAGDVANAYHPVAKMRLRSEHWANALKSGPVAAKSMLGQKFADMHKAEGVVLRLSVVVDKIVGSENRVTGVQINGDETVPADLVLIGVGAIPNVQLAEAAGLDVERGILTDEFLQTSDPDIYAAGDVANAYHPVAKMRLRSEHWANALKSGPVAAKSMLGQKVPYDDIPYFYTDQFDIGMEYSGFGPMTKGAQLVYRGDSSTHEFIVFWLADGKVVAGMNVNVWDVNEDVQGIIRRGNVVDPAKLADESVPLGSL